jgi:hypothetical protein
MRTFTSNNLGQYFAIVLLMISLLACGVVSTPPAAIAPAETTSSQPDSAPAATATQETSAEPVGSSPQNPAPRTETIETADWEFNVVEVHRGEEAMAILKEASPFNKAHPDPAMGYVLLKVHAKYIGTDTDTHHIDGSFFRGMGSANVMYERVSSTEAKAPDPTMSSFDDLSLGGEVEGWTVIQVANDETGILLVIWPRDNGMLLGEETIRYISLE